jgi:hypothetical protein
MYKEIVDPNFTWDNFTIEEQNEILASKRSNNCLDTTKLVNETKTTINEIKHSVYNALVRMKMNELL